MNETYPKVLIVNTQAFNYASGPGITLSNLFRGWPKDSLATIHDDNIPTTTDVCDKYYPLSNEEACWRIPLVKLLYAYCRVSRKVNVKGAHPDVMGNPPPGVQRKRNWLLRLIEYYRVRINPRDLFLRYKVSPSLMEWINTFSPDIIYIQPSGICHMSLARQIQIKTGAKLVIHFMDDWPMLYMEPDIFHGFRAKETLHWLLQMIENSSLRLTISGKMADEYKRRYGYEFKPFHNPASISLVASSSEKKRERHTPARIVYSGGISARNQLAALQTICKSVKALNAQGLSAKFHIYTHPRWRAMYADKLQSECVVFEDYVADQSEINAIYQSSDLLVIPLCFGKTTLKYTALSMPTKVTSYMASGTPILVYAPTSTALSAYATEQDWAFTVSEPEEKCLRRVLHKALTNDALRIKFSARAMEVARVNHEEHVVQARLHACLRDCCKSYPQVY